jgi:hypothetical protein
MAKAIPPDRLDPDPIKKFLVAQTSPANLPNYIQHQHAVVDADMTLSLAEKALLLEGSHQRVQQVMALKSPTHWVVIWVV